MISCELVESHLHAHPNIEGACVVAKPGETLSFAELKDFILGREIAKFKIPERLEVVDALPLSPAGTILRRELARIIAEMVASESGHGRGVTFPMSDVDRWQAYTQEAIDGGN